MSKYDLVDNFHLPLSQAAKHFKVSETFLKKVCRMHNIPRWPYRKAHHDRSIISVSFDFYAPLHYSWVDGAISDPTLLVLLSDSVRNKQDVETSQPGELPA